MILRDLAEGTKPGFTSHVSRIPPAKGDDLVAPSPDDLSNFTYLFTSHPRPPLPNNPTTASGGLHVLEHILICAVSGPGFNGIIQYPLPSLGVINDGIVQKPVTDIRSATDTIVAHQELEVCGVPSARTNGTTMS